VYSVIAAQNRLTQQGKKDLEELKETPKIVDVLVVTLNSNIYLKIIPPNFEVNFSL
jgi:hypothetical protein